MVGFLRRKSPRRPPPPPCWPPPLASQLRLMVMRPPPPAGSCLARLTAGALLVSETFAGAVPPVCVIARPSADVDAEVERDAAQTVGVSLADSAELPLRAVAVELAEDH